MAFWSLNIPLFLGLSIHASTPRIVVGFILIALFVQSIANTSCHAASSTPDYTLRRLPRPSASSLLPTSQFPSLLPHAYHASLQTTFARNGLPGQPVDAHLCCAHAAHHCSATVTGAFKSRRRPTSPEIKQPASCLVAVFVSEAGSGCASRPLRSDIASCLGVARALESLD
ncbi:hypothetical protein V2A60_000827 [Cordyceps javanica]